MIRKFHSVFQHQEHSTTLHTYDRQPENGAKRNAAKVTFRKPANWVSFIKIRPAPDPVQIEAFAKIRNVVADIDPVREGEGRGRERRRKGGRALETERERERERERDVI